MKKQMTLPVALVIFAAIFAVMFTSLVYIKVEPHIPLLTSLILISAIGALFGAKWDTIEKGIINGIVSGLQPIFILLTVGLVIASWMLSGTVPTLLFYGMDIIQPEWFALSALFITILVSSFTGSSFTTVGTVGVALMGISHVLGVNPALAAGAIVSGACFGDKMSPLSDSTNFAPGIAEVNMFDHIRHMMWTTVPALILTAIAFYVLGGDGAGATNFKEIKEIQSVLSDQFPIHSLTLVSPLLVLVLAFRKLPIMPVLLTGVLVSIAISFILIPDLTVQKVMNVMQNGLQMKTGNEAVDTIVNKGGLLSMMWSVSLILIALALGGVIQALGLFDLLFASVKNSAQNAGKLIVTTLASSVGINLLAGEMYLSILLPGQALKDAYEKSGVPLKNLSRTLEDGGTLVNPLVPWSVSGAFFASTLGVSVLEYIPFALFLWLSPMFTLLFAYTGWSVQPKTAQKVEKQTAA
ncbi:Na+/H+ antiporter NhaC [Fictibacillus barbaricus]|uniref:NhaC family Na+:H+ antiporter n=1 Tax=Fictibacillus barbaricus TaxID=182136 RepID=A0ABU1U519_9BACL|nr:Na+/H+ antiporter NhaC [Fictibacillus barbaricus]MDR7074572.1 NhaC family Na+:H+ antiporter [Fictibacillus barbaricus]